MKRKFVPFDQDVIFGELLELAQQHRAKLFFSMDLYANTSLVEAICGGGQGLQRGSDGDPTRKEGISGSSHLLRGSSEERDPRINVLTVYKKETQDVPDRILKTAKERMRRHRES